MKYKIDYSYGDTIYSNTRYYSKATEILHTMLAVINKGGDAWFVLSYAKTNVPILEYNYHLHNKILIYDVKMPKILKHFAESFGGELKCQVL